MTREGENFDWKEGEDTFSPEAKNLFVPLPFPRDFRDEEFLWMHYPYAICDREGEAFYATYDKYWVLVEERRNAITASEKEKEKEKERAR